MHPCVGQIYLTFNPCFLGCAVLLLRRLPGGPPHLPDLSRRPAAALGADLDLRRSAAAAPRRGLAGADNFCLQVVQLLLLW